MISPVKRKFSRRKIQRTLPLIVLILSLVFSGCVGTRKSIQSERTIPAKDTTTAIQVETEEVTVDTLEASPNQNLRFLPAKISEDSTLADTVAYLPLVDSSLVGNDSLLESTLVDSSTALTDSIQKPKEDKSDLDTSIVYSADRIGFNVLTRSSILKGHASIKYKDMFLQASNIEVDWNNNLMTATPTLDTIWTDTTKTEIDTIRVEGLPTFKQGSSNMVGDLMRVNMKTKQGYIEGGRTDYGDGFYIGQNIQKVTDDILFIKDGKYTTCDHDEPHFCFAGNEMMMMYKDKVVGKPVVLQFGDVPVAALPFAVFSVKSGRHSGILIPTYGDNGTQGRHLRNLGYYWAASDYWDMKNTIDFYEKTGFLLRTDLVYNKRNKFRGGVAGSINNQTINGIQNTRWDLRVRHDQDISDRTKIRVNGTFVSDGSYYQDNSLNANRRLDQKIQSNATMTHRFNSGASMSMNLNQEQNLATDENKQTLPNVSFNLGSKNLFPSKDKKRSSDKNLIYTPPEARLGRGERREKEDDKERWYNSITYRYSNRLQNQRTESRETSGNIETPLVEEYRSGITHSVSLNAPQKVLKHFNLNPSVSYKEDWFNERKHYSIEDDGSFEENTERGFFQRRTFTTSLTTNTKFYGYFNINRGSLKVIRHVVTPSLSFSYKPDFSSTDWGYYQNSSRMVREIEEIDGIDTTWVMNEYAFSKDRYTGSIFGGSGRGKSQTMSFSLGNLFQMKRVKYDEEGEEEEIKTDLFTYNLSSNYNFAKDSLNLGDLRGTLRASPISGQNKIGPLESLSFDFSTTHSFYQYDQETGKTINKYYSELGRGANLIRLTNFSSNARFTLAGKSPFTREERRDPAEEDSLDYEDADDVLREFDDRFRDPTENMSRSRGGSPWKLSGNFRYTMSMANPLRVTETIRLTGTATVKLTPKWNFQYTSGVDLHTRDITSSSLSVVRDLHCWEGRFTWNPRGIGQGFYLNISIKSPQLRDVKLEQKRGAGALSSYY